MSENKELETKDIINSPDAETEIKTDVVNTDEATSNNNASATDGAASNKNASSDSEKETEKKPPVESDQAESKKIGNKILIGALIAYAFIVSIVGILCYLSPAKAKEPDVLDLVQLGQYKELSINVEPVSVSDEEINEQIQSLVDDAGGLYAETNQPIKEGDLMTADITPIEENGEAISAETDVDVQLVMSSGQAPDEFIEALIGKKVGDEVTSTIPGMNEGQLVTYKIVVKKVETPSTEPTDDFVKTLEIEDVETVAELRESISNFITNYKLGVLEDRVKAELLRQVVANATFDEIPTELYDQYKENFYLAVDRDVEAANAEAEDEESKITAKEYIKQKMEEAGFTGTEKEYVDALADYEIKTNLIILKIAKVENLKADEARILSLAATDWAKDTEDYPTLLDYVQANDTSGYELEINKEDVMEVLYHNAIITEVSDSSDTEAETDTETEVIPETTSEAEPTEEVPAENTNAESTD